MAHVLDLPGCTVRAENKNDAISQLPCAIQAYSGWLRNHGETILLGGEAIEIEIAEDRIGGGPFDPGDAAALFLPDQRSLSLQEMESLIRLISFSRDDLLALVTPLSTQVLDWQPSPQDFSIHRILRHIGNAEEWYVSRITPSQKLPIEWEHDEDLPILEFLEMERRTAVDCICHWTEEERSNVFYTQAWTQNPDEPWTARKALRRFLEHEREHTSQIHELLAVYRLK
jgi:uncharacterized damage-inducible protein DinB